MKLKRMAVLVWIAVSWQAVAQSWDTSGNGLLNGTFYFRQVAYQLYDSVGDLADAVAVYGNITFDGKGTYSITGTFVDGAANRSQAITKTGTYSISASGFGFLSNPNPLSTGLIYGLVSQSIFIGSSTENQDFFNDLFIAAPVSANQAANAAFQGSYTIALMDFASFSPTQVFDSLFQLNPNGQGTLGTVNVTAYLVGQNGPTSTTAAEAGVRYSFSNGAASLTFPNGSVPVTGQKFLYISPDGNFVFGGSPTGFDMFVGVRPSGTAPNFSGLYYQVGLDEDESQILSGLTAPDSYYGSLDALSTGTILGHQRILAWLEQSPNYDYTYSDTFLINSDGTFDNYLGFHYVFGSGGALRIGFGKGPYFGLNVALRAPSFSGPGVYLNPTGIGNAGSSALFTSDIAPGELITLYGTNLSSTSLASSSFPLTLGGVQVMINNRPAPIYVVNQDPNYVIAMVPYATSELIAEIQVINNGVASNKVTVLTGVTAPGALTIPAGGLGYVAAQHLDYSTVTSTHPAQIGETIVLYVTGLGAVSPVIADGAPTPSNHQTLAVQPIGVAIDGQDASIGFAGLTPTAIGLYQINLTVPSGVRSGDRYIAISGPDSFTEQALISIGSGVAATATNSRLTRLRRPLTSTPATHRRPAPK